jgi:predicted nucleic acid-binding protein
MNPLAGRLREYDLVAVDSCVLIYFLEAHPVYGPAGKTVMQMIEKGEVKGISSTVAFLEVMVGVYRAKSPHLADKYYALLREFPRLEWVELDFEIADLAAKIRAQYNISSPDAIQLATARLGGADVFLTNNRDLARVKESKVLILDDYCRP